MNKCYSGYLSNSDSLMKSASGGIAYALSVNTIDRGGVVYGVAYNTSFSETLWKRCVAEEELSDIRGTKYVKANASLLSSNITVYDSVIIDLSKGRLVLFIGLPCEVGALKRKVQNKQIDDDKLITVDLICQGPATPKLLNEYLGIKKKQYGGNPIEMNMRYKMPDGKNPHFYIKFDNGKECCEPLRETEFWSACVHMPMASCTKCRFKGDSHASDITIGDHWGITEKDSLYNIMGTSIAFVHTIKGEELLLNSDLLTIHEADRDIALKANPRYSSSVEIDEKKERYRRLYEERGLEYAHKHRKTIKDKIKSLIRL